MIIRTVVLKFCLVWSYVFCYIWGKSMKKYWGGTFQWRNQTKHYFMLNVLTIITFARSDGFNQINSILKLSSCSRQQVKYYLPFILSNCQNYTCQKVLTFNWDSLYTVHWESPHWERQMQSHIIYCGIIFFAFSPSGFEIWVEIYLVTIL